MKKINDFPTWNQIHEKSLTLKSSESIKNINNSYDQDKENFYLLVLANFVKNFNKNNIDVYKWLLDELKAFEHNFGEYINMQVNLNSENYYKNAKNFFSIFDYDNSSIITSIDTFNYSSFDNIYQGKLHHINGDTNHPIFGIDSEEGLDEDNLRFSKTSRRMELDMIEEKYDGNVPFENIVIYGHSLCEADYSYFFSIFDKVKIYDTEEKSKIVFAYSIPGNTKDEQKANESKTKNNIIKGINNLFKEYARYKGYIEQPYRMLDFLTTQRRVILYEI